MKNNKELLLEKMSALKNELDAIDREERAAQNKKLVGKCFKYRNSYGGAKSEAERWWTYRLITRIGAQGNLRACEFQRDYNGKIEINPDAPYFVSGWTAITRAEFNRAWRALQKSIANGRALEPAP